jgi:hypothetical protein
VCEMCAEISCMNECILSMNQVSECLNEIGVYMCVKWVYV